MKTTILSRNVPFTILASVLAILLSHRPAHDATADVVPLIPVMGIRATVPETREPFCDPAVCDAAIPAPGVFVVSRRGGDPARELTVLLTYEGTATSGADYPALP